MVPTITLDPYSIEKSLILASLAMVNFRLPGRLTELGLGWRDGCADDCLIGGWSCAGGADELLKLRLFDASAGGERDGQGCPSIRAPPRPAGPHER